MNYLVMINNKTYELKSKKEAYTIYNRAGHDVKKILFNKTDSAKIWTAIKCNL